VVAPDQVYPETSLLSRLETGAVDAAVVYRNMAVERGVEYVGLPAAVDLSDPSSDDTYAGASYTLSDGTTVTGRHVAYGARARRDGTAPREVFDVLADGDVLTESGLVVPDSFPTYEGEVPRGVRG